ncbi:MAG TPA: hypothetical protein PLH23_19720 [Hyphomonadaceae bacterium]|nr:hypothetical protein [Hyphomonadaceae bacterium]
MRGLACVVVLTLATACGAPQGDETGQSAAGPSMQADGMPRDTVGERPYAGEWAAEANDCADSRKIWTIESNRMGIRKQRFCVFSQVRQTESTEGEVWRADARCLAGGKESEDVLFFRVKPSRLEMRVRISDNDPEELVRCPMRT